MVELSSLDHLTCLRHAVQPSASTYRTSLDLQITVIPSAWIPVSLEHACRLQMVSLEVKTWHKETAFASRTRKPGYGRCEVLFVQKCGQQRIRVGYPCLHHTHSGEPNLYSIHLHPLWILESAVYTNVNSIVFTRTYGCRTLRLQRTEYEECHWNFIVKAALELCWPSCFRYALGVVGILLPLYTFQNSERYFTSAKKFVICLYVRICM
jgi:hypothetical protein